MQQINPQLGQLPQTKKRYSQSDSRQNISISGQMSRWATSRQSDCQGCPRSSSQQPRPPGAEQQRCGCTNKLMHFSAGSHTSAGVQIKWLGDCSGQTKVEDEWIGPASSSSPGSTLKAHLKSIFRVSVQSHPFLKC